MDAPRDRQIIDAAARLFYERGFHSVGIDDIGEAVGISGPAIYKHFSGKDEILATLLNDAIDEIVTRTAPDDDPHVELEHLLRSQSEFAVSHRELVSVYTRDDRALQDPWRRHFHRRARRHEEHWIRLLRRCYPDASDDRIVWAAHTLMGMIHSVARWPKTTRMGDGVVDLLTEMAKGALHALEAEPPAPARNGRRDWVKQAR